MKITQIVLQGFKRLALANVNFIEIDFTKEHQLIIGTNGSGKSTLIEELSPLPPRKADFNAGGYKLITIDGNESKYVIRSGYEGSKFHHSFIKNGIELNDGGTQPVQLSLCRQEFNLTPEIFSLLIGDTRFTQMTPNVRRDWMTKFGGGDMSFALKVFGNVRKKHSDARTLVKHYQERIVTESNQLMSEEQITELSKQCQNLKEDLAFLIEQKEPDLPMLQTVENKVMELKADLMESSKWILDQDIVFTGELADAKSIKDIEYILNSKIGESRFVDQRKDTIQTEYAKVKDIVRSLESNNVTSLSDLKERIVALKGSADDLANRVTSVDVSSTTGHMIAPVQGILPSVISLAMQLPDNQNKIYTRDARDKMIERKQELSKSIDKGNRLLGEVEHKLTHIRKAAGAECPKCGHTFKVGVHESEEELMKLAQSYETKLKELEDAKYMATDFLEGYSDYVAKYSELATLCRDNPSLVLVDNVIKSFDPLTESPLILRDRLKVLMDDLAILRERDQILRQIELNETALEHSKQIMSKDNENASGKMTDLKSELEDCMELSKRFSDEIKDISAIHRKVTEYTNKGQRALSLVDEINSSFDLLVRVIRRNCIQDDIVERQGELAIKQTELNKVDAKRRMLKDLEAQSINSIESRDLLKCLEEVLSPKDGIIAEQSRLFVDGFISEVNNIIASVWEHGLEVMSCPIESDELSYKFPLIINGGSLDTPDISKCSSGQRDVIDFAFRIVSIFYLGLDHYPLYLDELAPTLDEKHRNNMMSFVKTFVETKRCSQMFMISHYIDNHGVFPYAESCVIDGTNILNLPSSYNHHVTIN